MMWIVGALYGGYVMANVLKWIWWRFNGYGYFWGMMAGIVGAMFIPEYAPDDCSRRSFSPEVAAVDHLNPIYYVPVLLVLSLIGCLVGTYLSTPEDAAILKNFYRTTRPWGFWGPIRDDVIARRSQLPAQPRLLERRHQRARRHRLADSASRRCRSSSCSANGSGWDTQSSPWQSPRCSSNLIGTTSYPTPWRILRSRRMSFRGRLADRGIWVTSAHAPQDVCGPGQDSSFAKAPAE